MYEDYDIEQNIEQEEDVQETEARRAPQRKRRGNAARIRKYRRQIIINRIIILVLAVVILILIIDKIADHFRTYATPLDTMVIVDENIYFRADTGLEGLGEYSSVGDMVEANYLSYLNKAYILFGTYPDCEYYKISPNVTRNDYDWENDFYVNSGGLYYSYFRDGVDQGKVAIDVSEFQQEIEWDKVRAAGVSVAIVRVGYRGYTSGEMRTDAYVSQNLSGATEAGLEVGAYFFSSAISREEGIEEANYALNIIKDYNITQPVVMDTEYVFENDMARANNISTEDRTAAVVGFCETIEAAGYTPMIYASRDHFIKNLDIDAIGKWDFWLAAYDTPVFPYHTEGYQYSPYGYVDGIPSQVDLNVWMR